MPTRPAAVAGQFYPGDPEALRDDVQRYMDESGVAPQPHRVAAVMTPHAGYRYSGHTAGHAFARVQGKAPTRVVLLGRSHGYAFEGASVYAGGAFETPLGEIPIDEPFAQALVAGAPGNPQKPHFKEHALEVQLPFLQVALGGAPIVPVLFGEDPAEWHIAFGEKLAGMLDEDDLVLASTDLSHYQSEEEANALDKHSLDCVLTQDCQRLARETESGDSSLCGATAVVAAMACAKARGADAWTLLDYRTSAQASGDHDRVVGYGAISMEHGA